MFVVWISVLALLLIVVFLVLPEVLHRLLERRRRQNRRGKDGRGFEVIKKEDRGK